MHMNFHCLLLFQDETGNTFIRSTNSLGHNVDKLGYNMELLKKIPAGAEIASVLVGESTDKLPTESWAINFNAVSARILLVVLFKDMVQSDSKLNFFGSFSICLDTELKRGNVDFHSHHSVTWITRAAGDHQKV